MTALTIRKELSDYIQIADEKQIRAIYTLLKRTSKKISVLV
jgi:hypothetical protein